jgi:uncharacterized protein with PIN domain
MTTHPFLRSSVVPAICPKCNAPALHRSHSQDSADRVRRNFSAKRKYRCHVCDWKGWLDETRLVYPSISLVGSIPTVSGEDVDIPSILLDTGDAEPTFQVPMDASLAGTEIADAHVSGNSDIDSGDRESAGDRAAITAGYHNNDESLSPTAKDALTSRGSEGVQTKEKEKSDRTSTSKNNTGTGDSNTEVNGIDRMTAQIPEAVSEKVHSRFHHHSRNKIVICPACSEYTLFRSRTRGIGELLRRRFTNKRPYRCQKCGWRGWVIKGM